MAWVDTKKHGLFRKWLYIQMAFLLLMILAALGIYLYTNEHIKRQIDELHVSNVQRTQVQIDAMLDSAVSAAEQYAISPSVRTLAKLDMDDNRRALVELVDDIKQTNASVPGVSEIVVWLEEESLYVSSAGVMDEQIFSQVYSRGQNGGIEQMMALPDSMERLVLVMCVRSGVQKRTVMYTQSASSGVYVGMVIDADQIVQVLSQHLHDDNDMLLVCTQDQQSLFATTDDVVCVQPLKSGEVIRVEVQQTDFYAVAGEPKYTELTVVSLIDPVRFSQRYIAIQRTAIIVLVVVTLLGAILSVWITRYKYAPVRRVNIASRAVTPQDIYFSSDDELKQIERAIAFIHAQEEQTKQVLGDHNQHIKNNTIKLLLDGVIQESDLSAHAAKLIGIAPKSVVSAAIVECKDTTWMQQLAAQIMRDIPSGKHTLIKGGRLIVIFEGQSGDVINELEHSKATAADQVTIAVGKHGTGYPGLRESYLSALTGMSKRILPDTGHVIPPMDARQEYAVTVASEDDVRFCGLIQAGDDADAAELLERLLSVRDADATDVFAYKSYLYNLSNTIIRSAEGLQDEGLTTELLRQMNDAFAQENHAAIVQSMRQAIGDVAQQYRNRMKSTNDALNTRVVQYIDVHIDDAQLSAEMIADAMSLNSAYLRRFFKEKNGIMLWDFINMKRIEMARELLISTTLSVKNVAQQCGYASISTFVRTFKKFSGMTPGHYRDLYR